jgi:hypothetical protein
MAATHGMISLTRLNMELRTYRPRQRKFQL